MTIDVGLSEPGFELSGRKVGPGRPPLVIAEIGINHEGSFDKAKRMVDDAARVGCECVKFQCHVVDDEMIPNDVVPGNATESIWDIMKRCALSEDEERELKRYVENSGMIYLSTPFSRAAADRLEAMGVSAYKIGSGECNNYPLVEHIAAFGKPVLLSTGMNGMDDIAVAVSILRRYGVPFALLQCSSIYPTPPGKVHLRAIPQMASAFPDAVVGFSSHSTDNYACFGAVALGASILERHFTSDLSWPGPDIEISVDPDGLADLIRGSRIVFESLGEGKRILPEEKPTIDFAYASVVTIAEIRAGDTFTKDNLWVKRPGTGELHARDYASILGRRAAEDIPAGVQLTRRHIADE